MKKVINLIWFAMLTGLAQSQNPVGVDSLYMLLGDSTKSIRERVTNTSAYFSDHYLYNKPDSALLVANELLANFKAQENQIGQMVFNRMIGTYYFNIADYENAVLYFKQSLAISRDLGIRKSEAANLNNLANIHAEQSSFGQAIDNYNQALKLYEQEEDIVGISSILHNIGSIYADQLDSEKALDYYKQSLELCEQTGDLNGISHATGNMGAMYVNLKNYEAALTHFNRSLEISKELEDLSGIAYCMYSLGNVHLDLGEHETAMTYLEQSLVTSDSINDKREMVEALLLMGRSYNSRSDFQAAIGICNRALEICQSIGNIRRERSSCECLYKGYRGLGKSDQALKYLEQSLALQDSLNLDQSGKKLQQMEFEKQLLADSLKQEEARLKLEMIHQQEVAKKDRSRNLFMGGGIIFLILAIGLYSRMRYVRMSKNRIEEEKNRSESLLLNILPAEIAEELKDKGEAAARNFNNVTILFTDFKDFTKASEKLTAADLVTEINICFKAFDDIVDKHGIEKIKTIGDSYMCAGGIPVPDEKAARKMVLAGLEMQEFMKYRKMECDNQGLLSFEMRVGIHSGPVVAGIVGRKKFQYDIWGDTVNTASRMESNGQPRKVNISHATYNLLKDDHQFSFESRGRIKTKGKGMIEMWFVEKNE